MSTTCLVEPVAVEHLEDRGFVGSPVGALEVVLTAAEEDMLKPIAENWARDCQVDAGRFREGVVLVAEVAGLPATCLESAGVFPTRSDIDVRSIVDAICHAVEDVVPVPGCLAELAASHATAVARSLQMFFVCSSSALLLADRANSGGHALKCLLNWLQTMTNTSLRCLRHAAISAGLGLLEALVKEIRRLTMDADACNKQLGTIGIEDEESSVAQRVSRIRQELEELHRIIPVLRSYASMVRDSVLQPHLRDRTSGIRLLAINAISLLIWTDPVFYRCPPWPERILRAFCDPNADVRSCAVQAVAGWFSETAEGAGSNDATPDSMQYGVTRQLAEFVPHAASLLVERARDINPKVSLAAVKALRFPKVAMGLGEKDIDSLVALCFCTSDSILRREITFFIDEHLLVDPGVGAATRRAALPIRHRGGALQGSEALRNLYRAEHGLLVLTDFLVHHLKRDSFCRIGCIVESLWGSAPCLQRWATMADLCLLGEGDGASRSVTALPALQRLAMLYLIEATLCRASEDYSRGENMEAVEEAAKALIPRLSRLLDLYGADETGMKPLSMSAKLLVEHSCRLATVLPPRALLPSLQKAIGKQVKLRTAENLVDALVVLAHQSSEARNLIFGLVKDVRNKSELALRMQMATTNMQDLAHCLVILLAFCNRGVDVSLGHYGLLSSCLKFLSEPLPAEGSPRSVACLTLQLLEMGILLIMWRTRAVVSAAAAETPQASRLDLNDNGDETDDMHLCGPPATPQDREMLPHAVWQLFDISIRLLSKPIEAFDPYTSLLQLQAISTYLTLAQVVIGSDGHLGIHKGFLSDQYGKGVVHVFTPPNEHVLALEKGLSSLYAAIPTITPTTSFLRESVDFDRQRAEQAKEDEPCESMVKHIAACRNSIEQLMDPHAEVKIAAREVTCLAACVASGMVSTCEIDAIYAGPPGRLVLAQAGSDEKFPWISEVACSFRGKLRKRASCSQLSAFQFFNMQLSAVDYVIVHGGVEAGERLSDNFIAAARACPPTGGAEDEHLKNGFCKAVRACVNSAVAVKQPSRLEAVLPWLRGSSSSCFLSLTAAKTLHREFSAKFGAGVMQGAVGRLQAAMRALLLALQPLANAVTEVPQRRAHVSGALSLRFVRAARRKLKLRSKKVASSKTSCDAFTPTGWIQKKRVSVPTKRRGFSKDGRTESSKKNRMEAIPSVAGMSVHAEQVPDISAKAKKASALPNASTSKRKQDARRTLEQSKMTPEIQEKRPRKGKVEQVPALSPALEPALMGSEQTNRNDSHAMLEQRPNAMRGLKRSTASDDLGSQIFSGADARVLPPPQLETDMVSSARSPKPLDATTQSVRQHETLDGNLLSHGDARIGGPSLEAKSPLTTPRPQLSTAPVPSGRRWRLRDVSEREF